jgi:hypothetical protein
MLDAHFLGSVVIALAVLVVVHQLIRLAMVAMLHRTLRHALRAGVPLTVEQLDRALGRAPAVERAAMDRRNGWVLVAIAVACGGCVALQDTAEAMRLAAGVALFPLLTGITLVLLAKRPGRAH